MSNDEPTVLDFIKSLLTPWRGAPLRLPPKPEPKPSSQSTAPGADEVLPPPIPVEEYTPSTAAPAAIAVVTIEEELAPQTTPAAEPAPATPGEAQPAIIYTPFPWRSLLALVLALAAQWSLRPRDGRDWKIGAILYLAAAGVLIWAYLRREFLFPLPDEAAQEKNSASFRKTLFLAAILVAGAAFVTLGDNQFTTLNLFLWILAIILMVGAFWLPEANRRGFRTVLKNWLQDPGIHISLRDYRLWLVLGVVFLVVFMRFYRISTVPPEMNSDHAEKLLDVYDVLHGEHRIFFPRNTGREAIQFYWTAGIATLLGTGVSFISLKIGTVLFGLLTLPFIYLIGREVAGRRAGIFALIFAGIAYWPNVISRVGLRFPLYPLFAAATLYFLIRGIRRNSRNDFILAGLVLGLGLQGYTPFRIMPFVVLAAVAIYLVHRAAAGKRSQILLSLVILALIALLAFLPLFRYALSNPDMFSYRAFSRLGSIDQPLPGPAWQIFLQNLWRASTMFFWDDGDIWVISVTNRPVLDLISGALLGLGIALLIVRYILKRNWVDLFLLISVPLMMMPSILSLAFPAENPAINRASGALVPAFIIVGIAMDGFYSTARRFRSATAGRWLAGALIVFLLLPALIQNYDLVFNQYYRQYSGGSWNTDEMGQAIADFSKTIGSGDNAWVLAFPHWVDTRLVGMQAGYITRDMAIFPENLASTLEVAGAKLFLVKPEDIEGLKMLLQLYPDGWVQEYPSKYADKNFYMFFVPPAQ